MTKTFTIGNTIYFPTYDAALGAWTVDALDTARSTLIPLDDAWGRPLKFPSLDLCLASCQAIHQQ